MPLLASASASPSVAHVIPIAPWAQLPLRKWPRIVVLVVRAQRVGPSAKESSHSLKVGFHRVHVEQKRRGGYLGFQQVSYSLSLIAADERHVGRMMVMNWTFASQRQAGHVKDRVSHVLHVHPWFQDTSPFGCQRSARGFPAHVPRVADINLATGNVVGGRRAR